MVKQGVSAFSHDSINHDQEGVIMKAKTKILILLMIGSVLVFSGCEDHATQGQNSIDQMPMDKFNPTMYINYSSEDGIFNITSKRMQYIPTANPDAKVKSNAMVLDTQSALDEGWSITDEYGKEDPLTENYVYSLQYTKPGQTSFIIKMFIDAGYPDVMVQRYINGVFDNEYHLFLTWTTL